MEWLDRETSDTLDFHRFESGPEAHLRHLEEPSSHDLGDVLEARLGLFFVSIQSYNPFEKLLLSILFLQPRKKKIRVC